MNKIHTNFAIIVAMDKNQVIGKDGKMPWNIPEDLQKFREITMGHPIIMGRKTHQAIGKILDGRENVILSRDRDSVCSKCRIVNSIEDVLEQYQNKSEVYIIGGGKIFSQFLPIVNFLYITYIDGEFVGDAFFPKINWKDWELIYKKEGASSSQSTYKYYFTKYKRKI